MTKAELKVFDELRLSLHALDKKIGRLQEQVTALAHEVDVLKQRLAFAATQQRPLDVVGKPMR